MSLALRCPQISFFACAHSLYVRFVADMGTQGCGFFEPEVGPLLVAQQRFLEYGR